MSQYMDQVIARLSTCSQPGMVLQQGPSPRLYDVRSQLRLRDGKPVLIVDDWHSTSDVDDPFLAELKAILAPINVGVYVAQTPWVNLLSNFNSRVAGLLPTYDDHILACVRSDTLLHDRHIETIEALLNPTAPRVVVITEPYGFGKTRTTAVAACCRFRNKLIVIIVDVANAEFAAKEARHTTAEVVVFTNKAAEIATVRRTDATVMVIVKRNMVGRLATVLLRTAAVIIMDEAYRVNSDEPLYIRNAQSLVGPATHWWVTDAFVTARSGSKGINDAARQKWLWQQINRFRVIAGLPAMPRHVPRSLVQRHVVQHADTVMNELAGCTDGWQRFPSNRNFTYRQGDKFTAAKAALLVQHIHKFFRSKPGLPRRVVIMGSFSNRIYVDGADRDLVLTSLRAQKGVTVHESRAQSVADRVATFNAATPAAGELAVLVVSQSTMKQVTLRANLMVCIGDAMWLRDSCMSFRGGMSRQREAFATLASIEGRIRRYEPTATEKFYRYLHEYVAPAPKAKRRKIIP